MIGVGLGGVEAEGDILCWKRQIKTKYMSVIKKGCGVGVNRWESG